MVPNETNPGLFHMIFQSLLSVPLQNVLKSHLEKSRICPNLTRFKTKSSTTTGLPWLHLHDSAVSRDMLFYTPRDMSCVHPGRRHWHSENYSRPSVSTTELGVSTHCRTALTRWWHITPRPACLSVTSQPRLVTPSRGRGLQVSIRARWELCSIMRCRLMWRYKQESSSHPPLLFSSQIAWYNCFDLWTRAGR